MQTNFEKVSSTLGRLHVEIKEDDYKSLVNKKIKEYAKTANVKGFRPGHVPLGYIQKLYGKSITVEEVIQVVSKSVNDFLAEQNLNYVGEPKVIDGAEPIDWHNQKDFNFEYEVGFTTDFSVNLEELPVITHYDVNPTEKEINDTIEDLKNRFGVDVEPEVSEVGDIIFGDLSQESSEFFFQSGIPTDKLKDAAKAQFLGLKKGDKLKIDLQSIFETVKELGFATGKSDEDAAQLVGEFDFEVSRISRMQPAEMNQEFFDKVLGPGKAENEDQLRIQVSEILKSTMNKDSESLLDYEVQKVLLDHVKFDLPEEFYKNFIIDINKEKVSLENIEKEFPLILRDTKLDLIYAKVAKENEIKIEYADVVDQVKKEIRGYFGGQNFEGMEKFVDEMAERQLKESKDNQKYYNGAFTNKVRNFVKEKIKIDRKTVTPEAFSDIVKEANEAAAAV